MRLIPPAACRAVLPLIAATTVLALPLAASARPGGWGGDDWGGGGWGSRNASRIQPQGSRPERSREGRVEVNRFVAPGAVLGSGSVAIAPPAEGSEADGDAAIFEAAVIDRLAASGYNTAVQAPAAAQIVEVHVRREEVEPAEVKHNPVSGEMTMGMSNHGSMMGMAINVDMRKPLKALVSTRLEARLRDAVSGAVLWEGRAETVTRDGDEKWTSTAVAEKLAGALFDAFPGESGETRMIR